MVRSFPASIRYSGVSFSFNTAYAIAGGVTPVIISLMVSFTHIMAPGYYVMLLFTLGALMGVYLCKREAAFISDDLKVESQ